jgi:hypothetical protein
MESFGPLRIDNPEESRFELALKLFEKGEFFVFRGAGFELCKNELEIRAPIHWSPEYVDKSKAEGVIYEAQEMLWELKKSSERFTTLVEGLPVRNVVIYDYGMGGLEIAESISGEFTWHDGYPKTDSTV